MTDVRQLTVFLSTPGSNEMKMDDVYDPKWTH